MKKFLMVLLGIATLLTCKKINAAEITSTFSRTFIGTYHYVDANGKFGDFEIFKRSDGRIAYCIEPNASFSSNEYLGFYNLTNSELASKAGISEAQLEKISLISYFAYGYGGHNDSTWIVAAQAKIWQILGRQFSFTSRNSQANPFAYVIETPQEIQERMNILEQLVQNYYQKPSSIDITIPLGSSHKVTSDLYENYLLTTPSEEVTLTNNTLTITPKTTTKKNVTLTKSFQNYASPFIVYYHNSSQNLILTGNIPSQQTTVSYQGIGGKIEITKYDKNTKKCLSSSNEPMGKAIYGLYQNDKLIKKIEIVNCQGSVSDLPIGNYTLKEIEAPKNYQLDLTKYPVSITEENISKTNKVQVYDEEKTNIVEIYKKYLKENTTPLPEENVTFEIINRKTGKIVKTLVTDKKGYAKTTLPYGTYIIRQTTGTKNYQYITPKEFTISDENTKPLTFTFVNIPYLKNIKVIKKDSILDTPIENETILFKLYDVTNEKYVCQNKECTFETNEKGELLINDLYYASYRLEEVQQKIGGYVWNTKPLEFVIDETTNNLLELTFYNEPVLGEIHIHKKNEENEPLENVTFLLYAKEDIIRNNTLLYEKGQLIMEAKTDPTGKVVFENLPLGTYIIKEQNTLEGYILNSENQSVTLEYVNESTFKIEKHLTIVNYKIPKTKKNETNVGLFLLGIGAWLYEKKHLR